MSSVSTEAPKFSSSRVWFAIGLFFLSTGVCVYGFYESHLFDQKIWMFGGGRKLALVFLFVGLVGAVIYRYNKRVFFGLSWFIFFVYMMSFSNLGAVFSVLLIILASFLIGDLCFKFLSYNINVPSAIYLTVPLKVSCGLAILATIAQYMAPWPINYQFVFVGMLVGVMLARYKYLIHLCGHLKNMSTYEARAQSWLLSLSVGLLLFSVALQVIVASKPEIGFDALTMHLAVPLYIENFHYWHFDVARSLMSVIPMAADMIFSVANMIGGEYAARLINMSFALIVAGMVYAIILPRVKPVLANLLIAAFLTTPLFSLETGSLFVENFWMMMIFSAGVVVFYSNGSVENRWILAAIFLSVAMATKVMTIFAIPVFMILYFIDVYRNKNQHRQIIKMLAFTILIMTLIGGYPYWLSLFKTGNPVFPFMNHIFKSPFFDVDAPFDNVLFHQEITWALLYNITFKSSLFLESQNGAMGFLWIAFFLPSLVMLSGRANRFGLFGIVLSIIVIVGVFNKQAYLRYLLPALPFVVVAISYYLDQMRRLPTLNLVSIWSLVLIVALNAYFFSASGWSHKGLIPTDPDEYVSLYAPERKLVEYINEFDKGAKVAFFGRYYPAGLASDSVSDIWHFPEFRKRVRSESSIQNVLSTLSDYAIDYVITRDDALKNYPKLRQALNNNSKILISINGFYLAKINPDVRWQKEILRNGSFKQDLRSWSVNGNVSIESEGARVTESGVLYQAVDINPGQRYKLKYQFECRSDFLFRSQINWINDKEKLVAVFLKPYNCDGAIQTIEDVVTAPLNAAKARIYVGLHNTGEARVKSVSMME